MPYRVLSVLLFVFVSAGSLAAQATCSAEIEFTNPKTTFSSGDKINLNIFSTVALGCTPAEIRLMAAFYDAEQNLVCSGIIESVAVQSTNTQSTNIELRPHNM